MGTMPSDNQGAGDQGRRVRIVARRLPAKERTRLEEAVRAGRLRQIARTDLLAPEALPRLAGQSLLLLVASGAAFGVLDAVARAAGHGGPLLPGLSPQVRAAVIVGANIAAYLAILPIHEAVHAAVILALGGRPTFGLKLPLAAYTTAPGQLFTRGGYRVIALAPLVALTAAGVVLTCLAPNLGALLLFGFAGNVAGAVGDLAAVGQLRTLPKSALIEDTATGFVAYEAAHPME
jgi:Putative zincin peptidase